MQILRTPDERFADLAGYPFEPHYVEVAATGGDDAERNGDGNGDGGDATLRVHYLDEGPSDGAVVLCMHGEPSWSYLYRRMIPLLADAGLRVIAPDLVGFGRSDKPADQHDYTYARHVAWMQAAIVDHLDLRGATLFGQDWGGLIGLRLVAAHPDRFDRVIVGNTGLPTGDGRPTDAFLAWQEFSRTTPVFDVGFLVNAATVTELTPAEVAAYDAPFPDDSYKAGARVFPTLVPTSPDDPAAEANRAAWTVFEQWDKPFICCFSDGDPITRGGDRPFRKRIPGAHGRPHVTVTGAHHFFQEDAAPQLAQIVVDAVTRG